MADLAFWVEAYSDTCPASTPGSKSVWTPGLHSECEEGEGGWDITNVTALFSHEETKGWLAEISFWVA